MVDDSSFMRKSISLILEKDPQFFVVGIARNGEEAIEKIQKLRPDIVTMDVEMPQMDGITAVGEIMKIYPLPVVMLSNYTEKGADVTIKALEQGAVDVFLKSELIGQNADQKNINEFINRLKAIVKNAKITALQNKVSEEKKIKSDEHKYKEKSQLVDIVIIATSTGGPAALQSILPKLPKNIRVPVLVLQHMPPGFTESLAERFDTFCNLRVREAKDGDILEAGKIYIAPSGFQTLLMKENEKNVMIKVVDISDEKILYKPSINITLNSAAPIYKERLLTVILTGMGKDGLIGCECVKKYNGHVIAEAEESCVVYGMPKAVFEAGLADVQLPLYSISEEIMKYI